MKVDENEENTKKGRRNKTTVTTEEARAPLEMTSPPECRLSADGTRAMRAHTSTRDTRKGFVSGNECAWPDTPCHCRLESARAWKGRIWSEEKGGSPRAGGETIGTQEMERGRAMTGP